MPTVFHHNLYQRELARTPGTAKECRLQLHAPVYGMGCMRSNWHRPLNVETGILLDPGGGDPRLGEHPRFRRSDAAPQAPMRTSFLFTNSSAASRPISRPVPLRLTPPNGSSGESASTRL